MNQLNTEELTKYDQELIKEISKGICDQSSVTGIQLTVQDGTRYIKINDSWYICHFSESLFSKVNDLVAITLENYYNKS